MWLTVRICHIQDDNITMSSMDPWLSKGQAPWALVPMPAGRIVHFAPVQIVVAMTTSVRLSRASV